MDILCPSCEKKLLLKLDPDIYASTWCGSCGQEVPLETLTDGGAPAELVAKIVPWAKKAKDLLEPDDDDDIGGDRDDRTFLAEWKGLRDETRDLLHELRAHVPAGTMVFGSGKPPDWTDPEILAWRRKRRREALIHSLGLQMGARHVADGAFPLEDGEKLPIDWPDVCKDPAERAEFHTGFIVGTQMGTFDLDVTTSILAHLKKRETTRRRKA